MLFCAVLGTHSWSLGSSISKMTVSVCGDVHDVSEVTCRLTHVETWYVMTIVSRGENSSLDGGGVEPRTDGD